LDEPCALLASVVHEPVPLQQRPPLLPQQLRERHEELCTHVPVTCFELLLNFKSALALHAHIRQPRAPPGFGGRRVTGDACAVGRSDASAYLGKRDSSSWY